MKQLWALVLLMLTSCNQQRAVRLIDLLPFAEKRADTEVILFTSGRFVDPDGSWTEPRRETGGRYRWMKTDRAKIAWTGSLSPPSYLHLRSIARESFSMDIYKEGKFHSRHAVEAGPTHLTLPLLAGTNQIELKSPHPEMLGVHSIIVTPSLNVAEFRRSNEFASRQHLYIKGKKRDAILFETGGAVSFYDRLQSKAVLEASYYFHPTQNQKDSATFSIFLDCKNGKRAKVFEKRVTSDAYGSARIPVSNQSADGSICKFEFHVARQTALGKSVTAWIEPQVWKTRVAPAPNEGMRDGALDHRNRNVVLIVLDAASVRRFGCYGYHRPTTPVLDRLASGGLLFSRAYTNAVYTLASTATLFTGQLPARHRILQHRNKLPRESKTLAEVLEVSGYETASFLANGNASGAFGLTQGFRTTREVFRDRNYVGWGEDITRAFSEWLQSKRSQKFFAYLHYREPHDPFNPPEPWVRRFVSASYSGQVGRTAPERVGIRTNSSQFTEEDRRHISNLYDANLAYADSQVGEVLSLLRKFGKEEDTIIVVTSDHGEAMWEHGYQGHNRQLYEESTRVPLIIRFPSGKPHREISFPVQHADLFPTLVDLLGIRARGLRLDGVSFLPALSGGGSSPDRSIVIHSTRKSPVALISGDYKYIRNEEDQHELYNVVRDPFERHNLSATEPLLAGYMNQILQEKLAASTRVAEKAEAAELDDEARENLRALGYVD